MDGVGRTRIGIAAGTVILGFVVMLGWHFNVPILLQLRSDWVPMQYNTALGFVLAGVALVLWSSRPRLTFGLGLSLVLLSGLTLAQYVTGTGLGIDELFVRHALTVKTASPGRMAPNTALAFLASGTALMVMGGRQRSHRHLWVVGGLALVIANLGVSSAFGYLVGVDDAFNWPHSTLMAAHTAIGFSGLGVALGLAAWEIGREEYRLPGMLLSLVAGTAVMVFSVDTFVPLGIFSGVAYAGVVAMALPSRSPGFVAAAAGAGIGSTLLGSLLAHPPALGGWSLAWRLIDLALIGTTWIFGRRWLESIKREPAASMDEGIRPWKLQPFGSSPVQKWLLAATVIACALPVVCNLAGVDFGILAGLPTPEELARLSAAERVDALHEALAGSFAHSLLEWAAFCTALFTVILAFTHFATRGDLVTPVLGMALFCAGCMDAFHTLAADRLIHATADNRNLIPFTWAICRLFNALILLVGIGVVLLGGRRLPFGRFGFILVSSVLFLILAWTVVRVCATSDRLPETMFAGQWISRPWDVAPLILFIIGGVWVFPIFHRHHRSCFSYALCLSAIPQIATQLHMAFGSSELFDNHFNIGHFLKILAYLVPLLGLVVDYAVTYRHLHERARQLARSNRELDEFAHVASHDLKSPLRAIDNLTQWIVEDCGEILPAESRRDLELVNSRVRRMEGLLDSLLEYSRIGRWEEEARREVDLNELVRKQFAMRQTRPGLRLHIEGELPCLRAPRGALNRVFGNLIDNVFKHHDRDVGEIRIGCESRRREYEFTVADDGPGIPPSFHERIFQMFQTLKPRDQLEASGIGLALVKKTIEFHGGKIRVGLAGDRGAIFRFTWPKPT